MSNDRNIEFTPATDFGTAGRNVDFTPSPTLQQGEGDGTGSQHGGTAGMDMSPGQATEQVREAAQNMVGDVQRRASEQVTSRLEAQKHVAADSLSNIAQTLRSTTEQLQSDGLSRYVARAADEVEHLAHYLEEREVGEILGQVEDFARRQPAAFVGGAFALGLLGARFLKSSGGGRTGRHERDTHTLTSRVMDPERDSVGRPGAPGYAMPSQRATSDFRATGQRME